MVEVYGIRKKARELRGVNRPGALLAAEGLELVANVLAAIEVAPPGPGTGYEHIQEPAAAVWTVNHNLGYKPGGIMVEDSAGDDWDADVEHIDVNTLTITFDGATAGKAYVS